MEHALGFPQFFLTLPMPCPYREGQVERKIFTSLGGHRASEINSLLSHEGFRRSQKVAYRPACHGCNACVSVRVRVADFTPGSSQRRIIKANADIVARPMSPLGRLEHYALFRAYLKARHATGGMAGMDMGDYKAMIEASPVDTQLVEYRLRPNSADEQQEKASELAPKSTLVAVALTDILQDGYSMVYSFYNPCLPHRSLGSMMILDHIARARAVGLAYIYLGYWVADSPKMHYKSRFQPLEKFVDDQWRQF